MRTIALVSLLLFSVGNACADEISDVTLTCGDLRLPSLKSVAAVTGVANFSSAYRARERLMQRAQQLCRRGDTAFVRLVPDSEFPASVEQIATR